MENNVKVTVDELRKLLYYIMRGYKVPKIIYDVVFKVAKIEVEDKKRVVLIKRDPNIHRDRIQAAYVKVIEGETVELHPGIVGGFGADFDGDTMAIYVPISEEAQKEAREKLITIYTSNKLYASNYKLTNEMLIGLYYATLELSNNQPIRIDNVQTLRTLHPHTVVYYPFKNVKTTSAGRLLFNMILPNWYEFVDKPVDKKVVSNILSNICKKSEEEFSVTFDTLQKFAFEYATRYPKTISLDLLTPLPKNLLDLKEKLMKEKDVDKQYIIIQQMEEELLKHLKNNVPDLYIMVSAGATKGIGQLRQIMVAKGLFTDPQGNIMPAIATAMNEGYKSEEYFNASAGARKGIINRVHTTSKGGYTYRKMVYVTGNTVASKNLNDCETRLFLKLKLTKDLFGRLSGRYVQDGFGGKIRPVTENMIGSVINLRSPALCKSYEICHICYGELLKQIKTTEVGILAAQECTSLSEKIMKAFHTGGAVSMSFVDLIGAFKENLDTKYEYLIDTNFEQVENKLITKSTMYLNVDKTKFKDVINKKDDKLELGLGYFTIRLQRFSNLPILVTIEQPVILNLKTAKSFIDSDKEIGIEYSQGSEFLEAPSVTMSPEKVATMLDSYVGGKSTFLSVENLYHKFYKLLSIFSDWDSVHLEVIIGTILRWRKDPRYPARCKYPFDPVMFNIKVLPSVMSWPLGVAFEDFNKSVSYGLISPSGYMSNLEKVIFGYSLASK
jgi:hypothetical protein